MWDSKEMKMKNIRRCIIFFVVLALLLGIGSAWISSRAQSMSKYVKGRSRTYTGIAAEPEGSVDMIVLGDSESYTSVSPLGIWADRGYSSYVCGQPGQKVQETYYMLRHALEKQSPKVVLMETNLMFRNPGFFGNIQTSLTEFLRYHMPVFRYHNLWKMLLDGRVPNDDYKGFTIRDGVKGCDSDKEKNYMKETTDKAEIPRTVHMYMEKIMDLCKKNGAELVLYSAPSPKNYNYKKHNAIEEYAGTKGLHYIDLNLKAKELGIDWKKDSYDRGDHLNLFGAQKVTAYLGKYIDEKYDMTDHRGDSVYQDWDRLAEKYLAELKKRIKN